MHKDYNPYDLIQVSVWRLGWSNRIRSKKAYLLIIHHDNGAHSVPERWTRIVWYRAESEAKRNFLYSHVTEKQTINAVGLRYSLVNPPEGFRVCSELQGINIPLNHQAVTHTAQLDRYVCFVQQKTYARIINWIEHNDRPTKTFWNKKGEYHQYHFKVRLPMFDFAAIYSRN